MGKFRREGGELVFTFGKYRGRLLREVAQDDPGYLDWMLSEAAFLEDVREIVSDALKRD